MTPQSTAEYLLTWLDVERILKKNTSLWSLMPEGILSIECFSDGMEVYHSNEDAEVDVWLSSIFGNGYIARDRKIKLRISDSYYQVEFVKDSAFQKAEVHSYPLWKEVTYISSDEPNDGDPSSTDVLVRLPIQWSNGPELISFHSFKGGVGRTTSLMTYVTACMQELSSSPRKVLVVDADLEAPGVSFWLDEVNRPQVSFIQFLEALHYPPKSIDETIDFFAEELRKTSLNVGSSTRELFVLPAAMGLNEIQDMPVAPEHLARDVSNPWKLSDHLHELGRRLGVDAIFIDLRAGLSELASPILFDPRIDHYFVSTVAPQSVQGMAEVLKRLYAFNSKLPKNFHEIARPTVILSLLTKELRELGHYEEALRALGEAYPSKDALSSGIQWLEAEFMSSLMSVGSLREALAVLPMASRLYSHATEWTHSLSALSDSTETNELDRFPIVSVSERQTLALKLKEVCESAEFADGGGTANILATEPLTNLGKHYSKELPNLLMIGAKGAGKTFTFRQLVSSKSWKNFLLKIGFDTTSASDAGIFPVLWSGNIEDKPGGEIKQAQEQSMSLLSLDNNNLLRGSEIQRSIKNSLENPPSHWDDFWDNLILSQFNLLGKDLHTLNQSLIKHAKKIILLFDGIEDAFRDVADRVSAEAIESLLRLPNRIGELDNRHLGLIVFVRADYVQYTVRQNLGQLLQRYQPFRLQWNVESFLKLAYMLSCQAGIYPDQPKSAESLRLEQLKEMLEKLWGKKLGGEKSKEAHSARWVYTALCDLKGNVQARDLVRFLKVTAELESVRAGSTWSNRILSPESMRKAIPQCSQQKVDEAKQEIAPLQKWISIMESHGVRNLKVPFSQTDAMLENQLLSALQELGVIYEDFDGKQGEERLFVPEIYRYGLNFETSTVGRPRTQALLKKNIGIIPL